MVARRISKPALALRYFYKPTYASHAGGFVVRIDKIRFAPNSALVNDACGRRSRAFFSASQRGR